jgi:AcrR family transcriptional regulator
MKTSSLPFMVSPPADPAKPVRAADRIRRTAGELFYTEGIRAVGVDEIVTRAGVTKPSLYRSFGSKDELAASYMRDYDKMFFKRFDDAIKKNEGDARAQLLTYFKYVAQRVGTPNYRGCGMTNAAVEYPNGQDKHPARLVAEANKRELRRRLREMAAQAGARDASALGDALLLLLEGCFVSSQLFGEDGPGLAVADAAKHLVDAYLAD